MSVLLFMKYLFLFIFLFHINLFCQSISPKREFRGAWVTTVGDLDWPSSNNLTSSEQQSELISLLDSLKAIGVNAVIFQVRSECDAMYNSPYEPWSYWLTGSQGKSPYPFYDPLEFAVKEAHRRGMELDAWFNPYRAVRTVNAYAQSQNHVTALHPDWIVKYGDSKILNPGLPQVRNYVVSVIMDVVRRYNIDGVNLDDYFYPYPKGNLKFNDDKAFKKYNYGFTNKDDWRRNNVNLLIKMVHDSIKAAKPYLKFGVSPFGIWKNGVPEGINGFSSYSKIYSDGVYWLKNHLIDYIAPQLYWQFGGKQDYGKLLNWWASQLNGRHLYPSLAAYKINKLGVTELLNQIRAGRSNPKVEGNILFRSFDGVLNNPQGFADSLHNNIYRYQALLPVMSWKDSIPPNPPVNLRYKNISSTNKIELNWDSPSRAIDGDTAFRFVVYKFFRGNFQRKDLDATHILEVVGINATNVKLLTDQDQYFTVTALDRLSNESAMSNIIHVKAFPFFSMGNLNPALLNFEHDFTNPFDSTTKISFRLSKNSFIIIKIFDVFGREVQPKVNKYFLSGKNIYLMPINNLPSGVYFLELYSDRTVSYCKMIVFNE